MPCEFISQLRKLRKSAPESIDNADSLDAFKVYLHVENEVEMDLRTLLRRVKARKCLVLVCGSAGDGKSHMVAYLKFNDTERLLDGYIPYNDATESDTPTQSALEKMAEKLAPFNDTNYEGLDDTKMIVAINLGTLSNFIDSAQGENFSKLKQYVELNGILSGHARENTYQEGSVFQHVSFSDYQLFTLTEHGVNTAFLETLLSRVFERRADNPFEQAYCAGSKCPYCKRCPVRHNYEFLFHPKYRKKVIDRIVEIVIKEKAIVSTREVLNLLYDLIVHPDFDAVSFFNPTNETVFLQDYIQFTTPMLLDECGDSELIRTMQKYDVLKRRKEEMDLDATRFHSLENIEEAFLTAASDTPYVGISELANLPVFGASKTELKKITYRFISRLRWFKDDPLTKPAQDHYQTYISNLYYQNSGKIHKLEKLYDGLERAVMNWNGQFGSERICIDDSNEHYWILENLKLQFTPPACIGSDQEEIVRFAPVLKLCLQKDGGSDEDKAEISVDYALFEMICAIEEGYQPTVQDKNHHTDFVSFVNQLIEFGGKTNRIFLVSKEDPTAPKLSFEKTRFKYKFGVI